MSVWQNIQSSIYNILKIDPKNNPRIDDSEKLQDKADVDTSSIIDEFFRSDIEKSEALGQSENGSTVTQRYSLGNLEIGAIPTNKAVRLYNYKMIAGFPEVKGAIEEIVDGMINQDDDGKIVYGNIVNHDLSKIELRQLEKAIDEYLELFDFESNMFEYATRFIEEGELSWENLYNKNNKDLGFTNIKFLEPLCYEYAKDIETNENIGLIIFSNNINSELQSYSDKNNDRLSQQSQEMLQGEKPALFMPFEFLTYIDSGIYSPKKSFAYPILERARRAYNQLMLIEDSIIIYRLVRAPKRLVFNVDVGKMPKHRAEMEIRKIVDKFNNKKVYNSATGGLENGYDAHTMLENMFFAKPTDGTGTTVADIGGEPQLNELPDLEYFVKKLYLSLKVPFTRYLEPKEEHRYGKDASLSSEEFKFSKFIIRLLNRFEKGLKDGAINHLKMKGLWESCNLDYRNVMIQFNHPTIYDLYIQQQIMETRVDIYDKFRTAAIDNMSSYAMKKYLDLRDTEIEDIWKSKENDETRMAIHKYNISQIEQSGKIPEEDELTDDDFGGGGYEPGGGGYEPGGGGYEPGGGDTGDMPSSMDEPGGMDMSDAGGSEPPEIDTSEMIG